jgi:hypothetical protein
MLLLAILIPIAYQYFIVGNGVKSNWSEEVWGGFLGSLWGGIIGGVGTLFAVFITTLETRKLQDRNEELRNNDKAENERLRNYDKSENEKLRINDKHEIEIKERTVFTNSIIEYVGKYITDINTYYYNIILKKPYKKKLDELKFQLNETENKLSTLLGEMGEWGIDDTKNRLEQQKLELEKNILLRQIQETQNEIKEFKINRTIAIECYFVLNIKLNKIITAQELLNKLHYIHIEGLKIKNFNIEKETNNLIDITQSFVDNYINA